MKARLLHADQDFDWRWALQAAAEREAVRAGRRYQRGREFDPHAGLPSNAEALASDLALPVLFEAMARQDDFVHEVARRVIFSGVNGDIDTILYRQAVLRDCFDNAAVVREIYATAVGAMAAHKGQYLGVLASYPDSVLRNAIERIVAQLPFLRRLRVLSETHAHQFVSRGWTDLFATFQRDLGEDYLTSVEGHLEALKFRGGELVSAELGRANKGRNYILHPPPERQFLWWRWWAELFGRKREIYRFELHPRDEAGARALGSLRNRGIALAAHALGRAADHVGDFFAMLRAEAAFYIGCLNLRDVLAAKGEPISLPRPVGIAERRLACRGLYDVALSLTIERRTVGNDVDADGKGLVVITGPNTGGKSTFLRSVGLAHLMMQAGMFVPAEALTASVCDGLFTHYKREEDTAMASGKFDEELARMSEIVDHVAPGSIVLLNESFAATNEREGSEIARQIISALLEAGVRAFCVTHMFELAHGFFETSPAPALFLRAEREAGGRRSFRLAEGEPLPTSFGEDLYDRIFQVPATAAS